MYVVTRIPKLILIIFLVFIFKTSIVCRFKVMTPKNFATHIITNQIIKEKIIVIGNIEPKDNVLRDEEVKAQQEIIDLEDMDIEIIGEGSLVFKDIKLRIKEIKINKKDINAFVIFESNVYHEVLKYIKFLIAPYENDYKSTFPSKESELIFNIQLELVKLKNSFEIEGNYSNLQNIILNKKSLLCRNILKIILLNEWIDFESFLVKIKDEISVANQYKKALQEDCPLKLINSCIIFEKECQLIIPIYSDGKNNYISDDINEDKDKQKIYRPLHKGIVPRK